MKVTGDTNKPTKSSQCNSNVAMCGKSRLCFNQVIQPFNQQLDFHETSEAFYISSGSSSKQYFALKAIHILRFFLSLYVAHYTCINILCYSSCKIQFYCAQPSQNVQSILCETIFYSFWCKSVLIPGRSVILDMIMGSQGWVSLY